MFKTHLTSSLLCLLAALGLSARAAGPQNLGYTNTPLIPGTA